MKTIRCVILIFAITILCAGCFTRPAYEYTEVYCRASEPFGSGFILDENVLHTEYNGHIYEFQSELSEKQRNDFISAQERLCTLLDTQGLSTSGQTFRALDDYENWSDSKDSIAYYTLGTINTWEQVLTTLQVSFGDYTNYGYLYALANKIAGDLEWQQDIVGDNAFDTAAIDSSLLNLVYPCFDEAYTNAEDVAVCKMIAKDLLSSIKNIWSEDEFLQARIDYAAAKDIDFHPTYITFAYYSQSCPLKLQTDHLEVFKTHTYKQDYYVSIGYIQEDYFASTEKIIQTFQWLDNNLAERHDTFKVVCEKLVPVYLKGETGKNGNQSFRGMFEHKGEACNIQAKTIHVLAHEYIHYLHWASGATTDPAYEQWISEVAAYYYAMAAEFEDYLLIGRTVDPGRIASIERLIGEDYDESDDYVKLTRASIRKRENVQYPHYLKKDTMLCAAFGKYFVRTYGEDAFLSWLFAPSAVKEITGKTTDEIIDDWCLDMEIPEND